MLNLVIITLYCVFFLYNTKIFMYVLHRLMANRFSVLSFFFIVIEQSIHKRRSRTFLHQCYTNHRLSRCWHRVRNDYVKNALLFVAVSFEQLVDRLVNRILSAIPMPMRAVTFACVTMYNMYAQSTAVSLCYNIQTIVIRQYCHVIPQFN